MRKLEFQDTFTASRFLKKTKLANEFKRLYQEGAKEGASVDLLGTDAIFAILDAAADTGTEEMVYEFLGDIAEKAPEEIKHLPIKDLVALFKDIATENDLQDFFKLVSQRMK